MSVTFLKHGPLASKAMVSYGGLPVIADLGSAKGVPPAPIIPGELVHIWDHFGKEWTTGLAMEALPGNFGNIIMMAGTFTRNVYNVQKWGGFAVPFLVDDTPSAWLKITEPQPTVDAE